MTASENSRQAGAMTRSGGDLTSGRAAGTGAPGSPARTWTIAMPAGQELLNANDRPHWAKRSRITRQLRSDAFLLARYAKVPLLERAHIDCFYEPADSRRRDAANWADSAKPCVDGFVDAGMLRDDSSAYLAGPFMHIGAKHPGGRLVFVITELTPKDPS